MNALLRVAGRRHPVGDEVDRRAIRCPLRPAIPFTARRQALRRAATDALHPQTRSGGRLRGLLSAPVIADQAKLSRAGAWNAIQDLERARLVIATGSGRGVRYQLDTGHPFAKPIVQLCSAEQDRLGKFFQAAKSAARKFAPHIEAVWLFGSVARNEDEPQSDLDLAVLVRSPRWRATVEQYRQALERPAAKWRLQPAVISLTTQELRDLPFTRPDFWQISTARTNTCGSPATAPKSLPRVARTL
ncbi:MAG: nucleotidyltransferase domain-containing protein [Gemmatimonadota bacterium]